MFPEIFCNKSEEKSCATPGLLYFHPRSFECLTTGKKPLTSQRGSNKLALRGLKGLKGRFETDDRLSAFLSLEWEDFEGRPKPASPRND